MTKNCASCAWFEADEDNGGYICTINPPDYKGDYSKTYPEYRCKQWESTADQIETKESYFTR